MSERQPRAVASADQEARAARAWGQTRLGERDDRSRPDYAQPGTRARAGDPLPQVRLRQVFTRKYGRGGGPGRIRRWIRERQIRRAVEN
jgi:hypothetical protein